MRGPICKSLLRAYIDIVKNAVFDYTPDRSREGPAGFQRPLCRADPARAAAVRVAISGWGEA